MPWEHDSWIGWRVSEHDLSRGASMQPRYAAGWDYRPRRTLGGANSGLGTTNRSTPLHILTGSALEDPGERKIMSRPHSNTTAMDARSYASTTEILDRFHGRGDALSKLAFLITGDQTAADQAVEEACNWTLQGKSPFRDWLFEWAKATTITFAIAHRREAIRVCEAAYKDQRCTHIEHFSQADDGDSTARLNLILDSCGPQLFAALDPLCRAVLALRVAIRCSIQDCALRLNVSRTAVLAANCRVLAWLHERR